MNPRGDPARCRQQCLRTDHGGCRGLGWAREQSCRDLFTSWLATQVVSIDRTIAVAGSPNQASRPTRGAAGKNSATSTAGETMTLHLRVVFRTALQWTQRVTGCHWQDRLELQSGTVGRALAHIELFLADARKSELSYTIIMSYKLMQRISGELKFAHACCSASLSMPLRGGAVACVACLRSLAGRETPNRSTPLAPAVGSASRSTADDETGRLEALDPDFLRIRISPEDDLKRVVTSRSSRLIRSPVREEGIGRPEGLRNPVVGIVYDV